MISTIVIKGTIGKLIYNRYKEVVVSSIDPLRPEKGRINNSIPTLYWTRNVSNVLTNLEIGTKVILRGHLESEKDIGLFVLVEYIECV